MENETLKRKVLNDMNMKENMIADLQRELKSEMDKPSDQWNCEKIAEITEAIHNISCEGSKETEEKSKNKLLKKIGELGTPTIKSYKWLSVAVACAAVVVGLNAFSLRALGQNIFSAAYQFTKGGILIDMSNDDNNIELPVTSTDPYGMKAKCAEYDMYPLTPTYIPEGFELVDLYEEKLTTLSNVTFYYKKADIILNFNFTMFSDDREIPPIGIPTDTYNIVEEQINGYKMYILKEDNQFTATFLEDNIVYAITAIDCDYDECQKVIESLVE